VTVIMTAASSSNENIQLWLSRVDLQEVEDTSMGWSRRFKEAKRGSRDGARVAGRGRVVLGRACCELFEETNISAELD
jgi:hypothetical protein